MKQLVATMMEVASFTFFLIISAHACLGAGSYRFPSGDVR